MGKSSGRKKKSANSGDQSSPTTTSSAQPNNNGLGGDSDPAAIVFLKRAHELKEEGNRLFQTKDFPGALEQYELALRLLPRAHPERAVFHSNRAACLLQMRPIDHEAVAAECSLALQAQPRYCRALLRRARALEALRRYDLALQDVNSLLALEPTHSDALDLARRLRVALSPSPSPSISTGQQPLASRPSPAALGASAVRAGAPVAGLGPCLPSRPVGAKKPSSPPQKLVGEKEKEKEKAVTGVSLGNGPLGLKTENSATGLSGLGGKGENGNKVGLGREEGKSGAGVAVDRVRPLKLVYDHDIRLAEMAVGCRFKELREIVARRFPCSKAVLVKYEDGDGDLVTVTSTRELRLAEACAEEIGGKKVREGGEEGKGKKLGVLRLYVVEVSPEQEPSVPDEEEGEDGSLSSSLVGDLPAEGVDDFGISASDVERVVAKENERKGCDHAECREVDIDDWLYEFAQLFRQQVGIDPDAHLDLHELGMELCSEALEETVTSKEAQALFEMSAAKFQEVAALAFFNWGNVHMCAARKRIPLDESLQREAMAARLQEAYDWVKERYALAGQKYEEALQAKPDFYEGLLALGQQHFETAKLHWSFALASKVDLTTWDSSETIKLFDSAEEKMKAATTMWEKAEEQRINELKDPSLNKKDELLKRKKKQGMMVDGQGELSAEEAAEQAAVMRSQIHLFWGNLLFERSQVEFKLGFGDWKKTLDGAVERFKLAGASEADISVVLKNHSSNGAIVENDENKFASSNTDKLEVPQKGEDKSELKN